MIFEGAGAVLLSVAFWKDHGAFGIFMGIFTSVTAFCNAGFDLCGVDGAYSSLTNYSGDPLVIMTVALLIILGGLGFIVWENFLNIRRVKKLSLHTRAVLISTGILVVISTLFYLLAEWDNPATLGGMDFGGKLMNSFFAGVTARTAGYNSVSVGDILCFSVLYFTLPEDVSGVDCLFEAVSAFSTAGLSAGPTAIAGVPGRILLMITMYIGRVGPVSLVLSMLMNAKRRNIVLPEGQIIVG